ncbi:hypothetical protein Q3G72_014676 [Acer saccharum]|nr:hypothetical protein Q3G72_014676 [Acer saccharum]
MRNSTRHAKATPGAYDGQVAPPCLAAPGHSSGAKVAPKGARRLGATMDVSSALAAKAAALRRPSALHRLEAGTSRLFLNDHALGQ